MSEIMIRGSQPSGWEKRMLGQVFRERREKGSDSEFPALSVTMQGILPQLETAAKTDRGDDRKVVRVGDYVINSRSDRKGSGGISALEGSVSLISIVMEPVEIVPKFAHHLLRSVAFQEEFYRFGRGIVADLWSTRFDDLKRIQVFLPSKERQAAIAFYLDRETARIDALIEKKIRFIELLKEKRQALITQAVTKGLDPNVPMRDSGVEWIGEVPEGWAVKNISYVFRAVGDVDHYMPASVDTGVPYLMTGDIKDFASEVSFDECKQVSQKDYRKLSRKIKTSKGDVVMARYATIGTSMYVDINLNFLVSYSCVTIKPEPSELSGQYLFYYLKSDAFFQGIKNQINSNTQDNVGIGDLKKVKIVLPNIREQGEIVEWLEDKIAKIDRLSEKSRCSIELLKERRSALITAAVTGQIDLREAA
ncbi:restriction endonuclease subunit S [Spongiibacter tropicus]|uniref:restriction endonuclease subunit S n=1 Tax=Spongiibacter tropicus TaxID=454602 RepID=UPI0030089ED4